MPRVDTRGRVDRPPTRLSPFPADNAPLLLTGLPCPLHLSSHYHGIQTRPLSQAAKAHLRSVRCTRFLSLPRLTSYGSVIVADGVTRRRSNARGLSLVNHAACRKIAISANFLHETERYRCPRRTLPSWNFSEYAWELMNSRS